MTFLWVIIRKSKNSLWFYTISYAVSIIAVNLALLRKWIFITASV